MSVVSSLSRTVEVLGRNPVLFGAAFVLTAVPVVPNAMQFAGPGLALVGTLLSFAVTLLVIPFLVGGTLGIADRAVTGRTEPRDFLPEGRENYLSLLAGWIPIYVLAIVVYVVLLMVFLVLAIFVVGIGMVYAGPGGGSSTAASTGGIVLLAGLAVLALLLGALPFFLVQFFPAAVVVEDRDVVEAFKRGVSVLRSNLLATVGFDLVVVALGAASGAAAWGVLVAAGTGLPGVGAGQPASTAPGLSTTGATAVLLYFVLSVAIGTIVGAFQYTYYVVFFRAITGSDGSDADGREDAGRYDRAEGQFRR